MDSAEILSFDIKAEAYAASLLEFDPKLEEAHQVLIRPGGTNGRILGRDISEVSRAVHFEHNEPTDFLYLDLTREGLLDYIPQGIFVDPLYETPEYLAKVELFEERRKEIYRFLLPFEQSIFHPRIAVEIAERNWVLDENVALERMYGEFIRTAFGAFTDLTHPEIAMMVKKLVGYLPWSQLLLDDEIIRTTALACIVDTEVSIDTKPGLATTIPESFQSTLGPELTLGQNFIIGSAFQDGLVMKELTVKIHTLDAIQSWMTNGVKYRFVQNLFVHLFFPADLQTDIQIEVTEDLRRFYLSDDTDNSRLGYVTYI
jgi:hypothetical protein